MKKIILTAFIVAFSAIGLFAQYNISANRPGRQMGQFQWKRTAQDSVNVYQIPFMENVYRDLIYNPDNDLLNPYNKHDIGMLFILQPASSKLKGRVKQNK